MCKTGEREGEVESEGEIEKEGAYKRRVRDKERGGRGRGRRPCEVNGGSV